jgi:3-hydroxymyristoyl/3-hydroxydecanoyl-(acyl carrier protein) dehydratase
MKKLDKKKISNLIRITGPFLMIDKILSLKKNEIICEKKNKKNEWFYRHHLKDNPIMPGVLQEEAMLQGAMLLLYLINKDKDHEFMLFKTNSNFFSNIKGAISLKIYSKINKTKNNFISISSNIKINKKIISSGDFVVIKKKYD